jgi:hypothetical protein
MWDKGGNARAGDYTFLCGKGNGNYQLGTEFFVHQRRGPAVKKVEFVSDRMLYIVLRGRWCNIIVLNVHARGACRALVGKPEGRKPLGRPRRRWEDNIKMDLREVGWGVDWICLVQVRDRWRAVVNTVMNLRVP